MSKTWWGPKRGRPTLRTIKPVILALFEAKTYLSLPSSYGLELLWAGDFDVLTFYLED